VILLLLRCGWSHVGLCPVDDVASRLVANTLCDVACRLTYGCCSCIYFLLTMCSSCDISIFTLNAMLIRLANLRGYVCRDYQDLSL
jgi:hypothetical protein